MFNLTFKIFEKNVKKQVKKFEYTYILALKISMKQYDGTVNSFSDINLSKEF